MKWKNLLPHPVDIEWNVTSHCFDKTRIHDLRLPSRFSFLFTWQKKVDFFFISLVPKKVENLFTRVFSLMEQDEIWFSWVQCFHGANVNWSGVANTLLMHVIWIFYVYIINSYSSMFSYCYYYNKLVEIFTVLLYYSFSNNPFSWVYWSRVISFFFCYVHVILIPQTSPYSNRKWIL